MDLRPAGTTACLVLFALGTLACAQEGRQPADGVTVDTAAIEADFDSMRAAYAEAVAAGDHETQASIYARDALYSPPMAPIVRGRDSIRAVLRRTNPAGATLEIEPMDVRIHGPDHAYEFGVGTMTYTPEGADQPRNESAAYAVFLERTASGWKIVRHVQSPNQPPPGGGM